MKHSASKNPARELIAHTEAQKSALIKLLGDDDPSVYETVRQKILSLGETALSWVRPNALSDDPLLRKRAREIIDYWGRQSADNQFLAFCLRQGEDFDLEQAVFLLAKTRYPEINPAGYQALLDGYALELRGRIDYESGAEGILAAINQYLFKTLGYSGNQENYYAPENSYLNTVIDQRAGNPISVCLVYLFVCRRLRLPIVGIGMPGHFLLRYQSSKGEVYIDAFNRGKLLTKAKCVKYLHQTTGFQEGYLSPASPRRVLLRICSNLHQICMTLKQAQEVERFQRYIIALAK